MNLKTAAATLVFAAGLFPAAAGSQTLDQRAWNAVWDRLESVLTHDQKAGETVHVLSFPMPATWVKRDNEGLRELQRIAGIVPRDVFSIDPDHKDLRLHDLYLSFVGDVSLPLQDPAQEKALLEANQRYGRAFNNYLTVLERYENLWKNRIADLERRREPIDSLARRRFREQYQGLFLEVQAELDASAAQIQRFAPVARQWADAVRKLTETVAGEKSDLNGIWDYEGNFASATSIGDDCIPDSKQGWEFLVFSKAISSEQVRNSNWNANGSWGGSFFEIGGSGGGTSYERMIETNDENVALKFCKLSYVDIGPGDWFDMSLLQAIDQGLVKLKDSPLSGRKILGREGAIPRLVKGVILARSISLEAHLGQTKLSEFKRESSGSGGVRIGPFKIGGGGGSSEYKREYEAQNGGYGRSTAYDVPVILAVVTEPTGD